MNYFSFPNRVSVLTIFQVIVLIALARDVQAVALQDDAGEEQSLSDDERKEAKGYFKEGSNRFSKGEYEEAIDQFQKAYEIVRSGEILYNIGRCYEALEEPEQAIYNYEMYLRFFPTAEDAGDVKQRITVLRELEEEEPDAEGAEEEISDEEESGEAHWYDGLGIGAQLGFAWGVAGPAHGASIPIELFVRYPLGDLLSASVAFDFGRYPGDSTITASNYPAKSLVGTQLGLRWNFSLSESFLIITGFDVGIRRINYYPDHRWNWLTGYLVGGINYNFGGSSWVLVSEIFCGLGPTWAKGGRDVVINTNLDPSPQFQVELGGKAGMKYVF